MPKLIPKLEIAAHFGNACSNKVVNINFFHNSKRTGICYRVFADNGVLWSDNGMLLSDNGMEER